MWGVATGRSPGSRPGLRAAGAVRETCVGSAPAFPGPPRGAASEWPRASSPTAGRLQLRAQLRSSSAEALQTGFPFSPTRGDARQNPRRKEKSRRSR